MISSLVCLLLIEHLISDSNLVSGLLFLNFHIFLVLQTCIFVKRKPQYCMKIVDRGEGSQDLHSAEQTYAFAC